MSYIARFQAAFESATRLAHAEAATAGALPVRVGATVRYGYQRQTYTGTVVRMYNGRGMPHFEWPLALCGRMHRGGPPLALTPQRRRCWTCTA